MATIIKRESQQYQSGTALRGVAYDLSDMAGQADHYLDSVRAETAKIVQDAQAEAEKIRAQAEESGRKAAEAAIERILDEKVAQQMRSLTPALAQAVSQIEDSRQQWLHHWEQSAIRLACSIAQRIIRQELKSQPDIAQQWIEEALRLSAGAAEITVRLHPSDRETLGGQVEKLAEVFRPAATTKIVADEAISKAGCRVETEFGSIDQQIETQLARIAQEME
ncbi:MAG: hypothetical protein KDA57_07115 [Planctomycetales bacterium]|nr:hypothetical protein [Planctomycetales bacterium]